jgi:Ankyrin repeats (3 copies)
MDRILPLELIYCITKWLTVDEYHRLRSTCHRFRTLDIVPTLRYIPFRRSYFADMRHDAYRPNDLMHMDLEDLDESSFMFLAEHKLLDEFKRVLACRKMNTISSETMNKTIQLLLDDPERSDELVLALVARGYVASNMYLTFTCNDFECSGNVLLHWACYRGNAELLSLLLADEKTDVRQADLSINMQPIHIAIVSEQTECLRLLIADGRLDVDAKDGEGNTALNLCFLYCLDDESLMLLEAGADPISPDDSGHRPIHNAANFGHHEAIRWLLKNPNVDPNVPDSHAHSALYIAVKQEHKDIVELLLSHKRVDAASRSEALRLAKETNSDFFVRLLTEHSKEC